MFVGKLTNIVRGMLDGTTNRSRFDYLLRDRGQKKRRPYSLESTKNSVTGNHVGRQEQ